MPNLVAFRRVDEKLSYGEKGVGMGVIFTAPRSHQHTETNIAPVEKATKKYG